VDGPYTDWKVPGDVLVTIDSGRNVTTDISFLPGEKEGKYVYTVRVSSRTNPQLSKTISFNLNVNLPPLFGVNSLELNKTESDVTATLYFWTRKNAYVDAVFELRDSENKTLASVSETQLANGNGKVSAVISVKDLTAGTYSVYAATDEGTLAESFEIKPVHDIKETVESSTTLFYKEFVISITNKGNTEENDYSITKTIVPEGDSVTAFITQPTSRSDADEGQKCSFTIESILRGETKLIVYRMEFWPSYTKAAAAIILIILLSTYYYIRISKPRIRKRVITKVNGEHMVVLEIKGPKLRNLKDVTVKDVVSPIGEVLNTELGHHIRPVVRRTENGTELIWKLGTMIKREERVMAYKIRTAIEGSIKMPQALMRFINHKGEKKRVYSRHMIID